MKKRLKESMLGVLGGGLAIGAAIGTVDNIIKSRANQKGRKAAKKDGKLELIKKIAAQRTADKANPKSKLAKGIKNKQAARRRHAEKIGAGLEPGKEMRVPITKTNFAASGNKERTKRMKDKHKGVVVSKGQDGKISTRYESLTESYRQWLING